MDKKQYDETTMSSADSLLIFEMMKVPVFEHDGYADIFEEGTQFKVVRWLLADMEQYANKYAVVGFTGELRIFEDDGTLLFDGHLLDSESFSRALGKLIQERDSLLRRAIRLAEEGHAGQVDKGGLPYIGHPIRVMSKCATLEEKIVAVMHDLLEDTDMTKEDLKMSGFPEEIVEAVVCLTKKKGEKYMDYIERVAKDELTAHVKLADLSDNMRLERIPNPTEKDFERLKKYEKAKARIEEVLLTIV